jgi:hypothetical protein
MNKARAQLLGSGSRLRLLLHAPTLIGQLDYELSHAFARRPKSTGLSRGFPLNNLKSQGTSFGPLVWYRIDAKATSNAQLAGAPEPVLSFVESLP